MMISFEAVVAQDFNSVLDSINRNNSIGKARLNLELIASSDIVDMFSKIPCEQSGKLLHRVGVGLYLNDDNMEAAQFLRDRVLPVWEACESKTTIDYANTVFNIGVFLQYAGRLREAKRFLYNGLQLYETVEDYPRIGVRYNGIARYYNTIQDYERAEFYLLSALESFPESDQNATRRARIKMDLGINQYYQNNFAKAIPYLLDAEKEFLATNDLARLAMTYHNIGLNYLKLRDLVQAQYYSNKALSLLDEESNPNLYSNEIELLAMVEKWRGNFSLSKSMVRKTMQLRKKNKSNRLSVSSSYENLAEIEFLQGNIKTAINYIDTAIYSIILNPIIDENGNPIIKNILSFNDQSLIRTLEIKAGFLKKTEQDHVSIDLYDKIDSLITNRLLSLKIETSKLTYFQLLLGSYEKAISLALELHNKHPEYGYHKKAFYYSTKTKALVLLSEIEYSNIQSLISNDQLIKREEALFQKINALYPLIYDQSGQKEEYLSNYLGLQRQMEQIKDSIDAELPFSASERYEALRPMKVEEIQSHITNKELYIEFFIGSESSYSFWINKDSFWCQTINNPDQLESQAKQFEQLLKKPNSSISEIRETGYELYKGLLYDGLNAVHNSSVNVLYFVADGFLQSINFESLTPDLSSGKYLIDDFIMSRSYSSRLLYNDKVKIGTKYLGFSTPYSSELSTKLKREGILKKEEQLASLSFTQEEIDYGNNLYNGRVYHGNSANKSTFKDQISSGNIVHLSLHGVVNKELPENSCLIFDDRTEDYLLKLGEIYSLDHYPDLIILSACHTATGKVLSGEGVQGISKAFLRTGNSQVVSSLWAASEVSSMKIMMGFLSHLKEGDSLGGALRKSKLEYIEMAPPSQQHPFYWSNIILIGNSNLIIDHSLPFYKYMLVGLIFLILLLLFIKVFKK